MIAGHCIDELRQGLLLLMRALRPHIWEESLERFRRCTASKSLGGTLKILASAASLATFMAEDGSISAPGCFTCRPRPEGGGYSRRKCCLCFSCASDPLASENAHFSAS
jgi:hypothetical protein